MKTTSCQRVPCALLALFASVLVVPQHAAACSIAKPPPRLIGQPADHDGQVPTDVVLQYETTTEPESKPADYVLRSDSGEQVLLDVQLAGERYVELKPASELRPNTQYSLVASWYLRSGVQIDSKVSFETGAGPLAQIPEAPRAVMNQFLLGVSRDRNACGGMRAGACISAANDDTWYEYSVIDAAERVQPAVLVRGSFKLGSYHCLELRERAANGKRSQPLRLCADDAPTTDLSELSAEPQLVCASTGMHWCEESGRTGSALGVDASGTEPPELDCVPTVSKQSAQLQQAGGPAPASANVPAAESGCSVLSTTAHDRQGVVMFATLGMLLLRRRRR